ncbi:MAG: TGS domain-containing protein, partial [Nanoarchaeota archaeon]
STALDFAFKIHTDLGKHFINAIDVKTKRRVGKDHVLKSGDVVEIVSGK